MVDRPFWTSTSEDSNRDNKDSFCICSIKLRVRYTRFLAFYGGPGGFRELREAYRKHFHRSWYLFEPGVTSYDQKPWGVHKIQIAVRDGCIEGLFTKILGGGTATPLCFFICVYKVFVVLYFLYTFYLNTCIFKALSFKKPPKNFPENAHKLAKKLSETPESNLNPCQKPSEHASGSC